MRVVSLLLVGLTVCATAHAADKTFSKRISADQAGSVQISNVAGSVMVTAWDRAEVDVQGQLGSGVERVDVTEESGRTIVKVVLPRHSQRDGDAKLEVRVPARSQLEVSTVSAPITIKGLRGALRLKSVSGDIDTDVAAADAEVKTVSGSVAIRGNGHPATMRVSTVSGGLSVTQGAGELEANTTSGDLDVGLAETRIARLRSVSGDLKLRGRLLSDARVEADTVSGSLSLQLEADTGYQYEASSFSGDIRSCFAEQAVHKNQYGPGSRLNGTYGTGKGNVRLKTLSGGIELCNR